MILSSYFSRIIRFIASPRQIPKKILKKYRFYRFLQNFDPTLLLEEQNLVYARYGMSRRVGVTRIAELESAHHVAIDDSEHTVFFAALSAAREKSINRILEIGTYDAKNARFLSILFPQATIITLDLADDDPLFINSYRRDDPERLNSFITSRNTVLAACDNVQAVRQNSLALTLDQKGDFDLIWVDGAHGYPVVPIDIANSLRLLSKGGVMACDDVWTEIEIEDSDKIYKSRATYDTLLAFESAKMIRFELINKRINFQNTDIVSGKEYIALVQRL